MASATSMPESPSTPLGRGLLGRGEEEPLLGRAGDASLEEGKPLYHNLLIGTLPGKSQNLSDCVHADL